MRNTQESGQAPPITILGKTGSPLGYMIRDFLHRNGVPFEWIELANSEEARAQMGAAPPATHRVAEPDRTLDLF